MEIIRHPGSSEEKGISRRRLLEDAIVGAGALLGGIALDRAIGYITRPQMPLQEKESSSISGIWFPERPWAEENYVNPQSFFTIKALGLHVQGSTIDHITWSADPYFLGSPKFYPDDPEQGSWQILGRTKSPDKQSGLYMLQLKLEPYHPFEGRPLILGFDVYGKDYANNPIVHHFPNGFRTIITHSVR